MSEAETRTRIVNVASETITGVVTFFEQIPYVLQDAQLPALVVFPGAATYDSKIEYGEQIDVDIRVYEMVLYISKALFGTQGQLQLEADPYFSSFRDAFNARPGLELPSQGANQTYSVLQTAMLGDGGLQVGPYPLAGQGSHDYIQLRFQLRVWELSPVLYRD